MDTLAALAWTLISLTGDTVDLRTYRNQPVIVHVWATWCVPCLTELRQIERWWQRQQRDSSTPLPKLLIVSPEPIAHVRQFIRKHKYRLPIYVEQSRMPTTYGLRTMPSTFFIDTPGMITHRLEGTQQWTIPPSW